MAGRHAEIYMFSRYYNRRKGLAHGLILWPCSFLFGLLSVSFSSIPFIKKRRKIKSLVFFLGGVFQKPYVWLLVFRYGILLKLTRKWDLSIASNHIAITTLDYKEVEHFFGRKIVHHEPIDYVHFAKTPWTFTVAIIKY